MSEQTQSSTTSSISRRRQRDEARDLIKRLRAENPTLDRAALVKLYVDHVKLIIESGDDPDAIEALNFNPLREWVSAQIVEPRQRVTAKSSEERAAAKTEMDAYQARLRERDGKRIEEIVTRRLLEWELIDGRLLGDLTGAECRNLSERYGVFFHVISDHIPARAKVRNHYTELELQALARHHKLIVP